MAICCRSGTPPDHSRLVGRGLLPPEALGARSEGLISSVPRWLHFGTLLISFQDPPRPLLGDQSGQGLELACRARLLP